MRLPFHCPLIEGEHLLSWFMRYHILSGRQKIKVSLASIGVARGRLKSYDFNETFLAVSEFYKENFDKNFCVTDHSPLALWAFSHGSEYFSAWKKDNQLQLRACFEPNKLAVPASWSYCPICQEEDRDNFGFSFWHLEHQIPGVILCGKHRTLLITDRKVLQVLGVATLPHAYAYQSELKYSDWMLDWNDFVLSIFSMLNSDPSVADKLKQQVDKILDLPESKSLADKKALMEHQKRFDTEVSINILQYLFKFYSQVYKYPPTVLGSTLGYKTYAKGKHPVYWLVILYWLKNEIDWVALK